jgi:hypothetical protein
MRGAILISGAYKNATEPIVDLLKWLRSQEGYEIDVYIHAWWDPSYVGKRYRYDHLSIVEDDPTQGIIEKIKPTSFKLEPQAPIDFTDLPYEHEAGGTTLQKELCYFATLSQAESLKRCFQLIDDPFKYDFIFRLRGDLFIENETYRIPFQKSDFQTNKVYIADGKFFTGWPLGDWAFIANPSIMKMFIENQEFLFRLICKKLGYGPHIHNFIPCIFNMIGAEPNAWYVPLKITRLSPKHCNHLILDTQSQDPNGKPFFWEFMDFERLNR